MRVLITGGTGFIGSRLALACLAAGEDVRVLGQTNTPGERANADEIRARGAEIRLGSVVDTASVEEACRGSDVVYHLAACQHEANVGDQQFWDVNVVGTGHVLDACVRTGVRRLVHGSTIGVYRAMPGQTVSERSPLEPQNIYGITKLEGEKLIAQKRGRYPVAIARISETYGPGDRRLLKLFRSIQKGRGVLIGEGANLHHPVYIDDLVEGLRRSATAEGAVNGPYVLAGDAPLTTRAMMETIGHELGKPAARVTVPFGPVWHLAALTEDVLRPLKVQPPLHRRRMNFFTLGFAFSGEDARKSIGFTPRTSFAEGIKRTAEWYRSQGLL